MELRTLDPSGIAVSRIILGCGNFGGIGSSPAFFGQGETREEAFAIMDAAWAAGITSFDTADAYGGGRSETWIGDWMRSRGHRPVLTTKTFNPMQDGADRGLGRERVRRQLHSSLERLGVEAVDLYLAHDMDPETPVEETAAAFGELADAGLIRAWGGSNVDTAWIERARPAWVQNSYSLLARDDEQGVLQVCAREGIGYSPFSPLAGGWLTGKYRRGEQPPAGSRMTQRPGPYAHLQRDEVFDTLEAFEQRAAERGTTPAALAIAWLLAQPQVAAVVIGPRRPEHLQPALDAVALDLSPRRARCAGRVVPVSVLVLSAEEVEQLLSMDECIEAMTEVLASLARGELYQPLRSIVFPPLAGSGIGLMPAHRGGERPAYSLKEIVVVPDNPSRGLDSHQGGVLLHDGDHGRAARDPQRVADHGHPNGGGIRRRDARARAPRRAGRGDHRAGRSGQVTRGGAEGRAGRPGDPDVEQSRGRHRPGARRRRRRGLHVHDLARAGRRARLARARHPCERGRLERADEPRALRGDDPRRDARRRPARVGAERVRRAAACRGWATSRSPPSSATCSSARTPGVRGPTS